MTITLLLVGFVPCEGSFIRQRQNEASSTSAAPDKAVCHAGEIIGYLNSQGGFYLPAADSQKDAKGYCVCSPPQQLLRCPDNPSNFPTITGNTPYKCSDTSTCPAQA